METEPTRPPFWKWLLCYVLPPCAIIIACLAAFAYVAKTLKPEPLQVEAPRILPRVNVIEARSSEVAVTVPSQGTVQPRTQTNLVAEVSGRVESISPALYAGGFFKKGEILARVDPTDYQAALASARSRLAEARLAYEQEKAAAAQAAEDWQAVGNDESPSALTLRQPQLERARANLEAAQAAVDTAARDLRRTRVTAPYDGRVREKFIDIGQFLSARQSQIAQIFSIDAAEVPLQITLSETRYLDLPEAYPDASDTSKPPSVTIEAKYGGRAYQWSGVIDRSEGTVDPQTRLLTVIARVEDPYRSDGDKPPLKIGTFVTAEIHGKTLENAFVIPRKALRENDTVYLVNRERRLEIRSVDVYQTTAEQAIIGGGLSEGDLVCVTSLQFVVDGMEVEIEGQANPPSRKSDIASSASTPKDA